MTDDSRDKLVGELIRHMPWPIMEPHYQRGAMFLVADVPLVDVGAALACDDSAQVQAWLADGTLSRPTPIDVDHWETVVTLFAAVIVQPYVLAQVERPEPGEN